MKTAIITGASSGLGKEYALAVCRMRPDIEEIWLIARREDKLRETAEELNCKSKILPLNLATEDSLIQYKTLLEQENPEIVMLINNAGFGRLGRFDQLSPAENAGMVRLNCEALTAVTSLTLPYMQRDAEIINTCSIASFAPNTRMAVYSSTKAYVMSFSKALRAELKPLGINTLAVCPGPMDTEFLPVAGIAPGSSKTFDTLPRVNPKVMAEKTLKASQQKKSVYTNLLFYKFYRVIAKVLPHNIVMKMCGA